MASLMSAASGAVSAEQLSLDELAGCPIKPDACEVMTSERTRLYDMASIDPVAFGASLASFVYRHADKSSKECGVLPEGDVLGPIARYRGRYFVVVGERASDRCSLRDLGEVTH